MAPIKSKYFITKPHNHHLINVLRPLLVYEQMNYTTLSIKNALNLSQEHFTK